MVLKTALLLLSLALQLWATYGAAIAHEGALYRLHLASAFGVVFVARVLGQMAWFWARDVTWNEVLVEAGVIIPLSLASLGHAAARRTEDLLRARGAAAAQLGARDWLALAVFLGGTGLNVGSELQRHLWKVDNPGRLYTRGLFRWARHINYTGEILSFVGFGLLGPAWAQWVALVMGVAMALFSVPELAHYLALRYPGEWRRYAAAVPWRLVPGVW